MRGSAAGRLALAGLACVAIVLWVSSGCGGDPPLVPPADQAPRTAVLDVAGRPVTVELAYTPAARERGLMHRTSLAQDAGMLFLFPSSEFRRFWMHDTLIALDIVFLDEAGRVLNIAHEAPPGVERPGFPSDGPARFVLELAGGWARAADLRPGARIVISEELRALAR